MVLRVPWQFVWVHCKATVITIHYCSITVSAICWHCLESWVCHCDQTSTCAKISTAQLLHTWLSSVNLSLASTDTSIYHLLAVASLTFHVLDCQHMEDERSVMLGRLLGTLFLSVSRTMPCFCLTLGTSSNISTSRPTSTHPKCVQGSFHS